MNTIDEIHTNQLHILKRYKPLLKALAYDITFLKVVSLVNTVLIVIILSVI